MPLVTPGRLGLLFDLRPWQTRQLVIESGLIEHQGGRPLASVEAFSAVVFEGKHRGFPRIFKPTLIGSEPTKKGRVGCDPDAPRESLAVLSGTRNLN